MEDTFDVVKEGIENILVEAQSVIKPKLRPLEELIDDIKVQLAHGTDRIPTSLLHEWGLTLSVIRTELSSQREAYALASGLWKVQINRSNAKSIAERRVEQKKVEIENQNIIDNSDKETQKLIIDYMSSMLRDAQEDIYQLCSELNRIMDARTRNLECK